MKYLPIGKTLIGGKIWPGQQNLIETTLRQQVAFAMKTFDPNYADWMVTITYRANINLEDTDSSLAPATVRTATHQVETMQWNRS